MVTEDPIDGTPIKDMLLDPNVAGVSEETDDLTGMPRDPSVQSRRGPTGVQLLVDMSEDDWEERVAEAFKAAAEEFGFKFNPDEPTEIITRG